MRGMRTFQTNGAIRGSGCSVSAARVDEEERRTVQAHPGVLVLPASFGRIRVNAPRCCDTNCNGARLGLCDLA